MVGDPHEAQNEASAKFWFPQLIQNIVSPNIAFNFGRFYLYNSRLCTSSAITIPSTNELVDRVRSAAGFRNVERVAIRWPEFTGDTQRRKFFDGVGVLGILSIPSHATAKSASIKG